MTDAPAPFQFGGGTIIPPRVKLLILDCFETLVELRGRAYVPRRGIPEFLDHFSGRRQVPIAILSDGEQAVVDAAVAQSGLADRLAVVVGAPESIELTADGQPLKRLDRMLGRFAATRDQTVFIGDSPLDAQAARTHEVPFVRVPRSEDRAFSFAALIAGPSRYQSTEFSAVFLETYLGNGKR
jgi:phosphoglycolate phosphatase-like HAD superfamily hydrolase